MHRFLGFTLGLLLGLTPLLKHPKITSSSIVPVAPLTTLTPTASSSDADPAAPIISPQEAAKVSLDDLEAELNSLFIEDEDFSDL